MNPFDDENDNKDDIASARSIAAPRRKVYTVSRLNQEVQSLLEKGFGTLWLEGELTNFSRPGSGHFYFTLKDSRAQVRCAMFKGRNRYVDFKPQNGDAVLVRGKLGLYAARGDFQLIVEHMEPAGAGKLQAVFEALKQQLKTDGWFADELKKPLPAMAQTIGVITSPTSAALRDVLQVLARRYRQAGIIIYPTPTQGAAAAPGIVKALQRANIRREADVLLLVRGGGSLEDLWAFNEIAVAQAIRDSELPVVTGIGHEIDTTISDWVADLRAPTPSAAAELATPDGVLLQRSVQAMTLRLHQHQLTTLKNLRQRLTQQDTRLQLRHPERALREQAQKVDDLVDRLQRGLQAKITQLSQRHLRISTRLRATSPDRTLRSQQQALQELDRRLQAAIASHQNRSRTRFELLTRALHAVSPLAVLDRGFSLVRKDGEIVRDATSLIAGDEINAQLASGEIVAEVKSIRSRQ